MPLPPLLRTLLLALLCLLALDACTSLPAMSPKPAQYRHAFGAQPRTLKTAYGLTLFGQWWIPEDGKPKAVVLLVHGTALHSGFYAPWADELITHHYAVFGFDLRGWGQSQGFGRRGYVRGYDEYLRDLMLAWQEVHRRYPDTPLFLQGESMGGSVALLSNIMNQFPVQGLVLNAPAVKPNPGFGFARLPGPVMSFMLWSGGNMAKIWPNFPAIPLDLPLIGEQIPRIAFNDDYARQQFLDDPDTTHSWLAAAYITGIAEATSRIQDNFVNVQAPFIVLQGTSDHLIPPESAELLVKDAGSSDKTLKLYPGMAHATLHDAGREKVWSDTLTWMNAHLPAPAGNTVQASVTSP